MWHPLLPPHTAGFALLGLIYMANHLTMAQFNPAVTVAFFLHGAVKSKKSLLHFLIAEMLGGALGGVLGREIIDKQGGLKVDHVGKVRSREEATGECRCHCMSMLSCVRLHRILFLVRLAECPYASATSLLRRGSWSFASPLGCCS